jgi:formylglycine-generating enzyme required for sulfatase activity
LAQIHGIASRRKNNIWDIHPTKLVKMLLNLDSYASEESFALAFRHLGPFVAIGRPGESLATPGASRMYVADDAWQTQVSDLLQRCGAVVLQPAQSEGIRWEEEQVLMRVPSDRILLNLVNFKDHPSHYEDFRSRLTSKFGLDLPLSIPFENRRLLVYFEAGRTYRVQPICYISPWLWTFRGNAVDSGRTFQTFIQGLSGSPRDLPLQPIHYRGHGFASSVAVAASFFLLVCLWAVYHASETVDENIRLNNQVAVAATPLDPGNKVGGGPEATLTASKTITHQPDKLERLRQMAHRLNESKAERAREPITRPSEKASGVGNADTRTVPRRESKGGRVVSEGGERHPAIADLRRETSPAQLGPERDSTAPPKLIAKAINRAVQPERIISTIEVNSIGVRLALIPSGEFLMGTPDADKGAQNNHREPQHKARITRPFYLGVTEVTQGQYRAVTGDNPSNYKGSDDLPVEQVSWNDAIAFCNKLSEREGLKAYYKFGAGEQSGGDGYRLPTEAEWEYACRAGASTRYSFGDDDASLGEYAWFKGNSTDRTHPVGQKRPNKFGLYDMHGNVEEWCWDRYYRDSARHPSLASFRVVRGGSLIDDPILPSLRSAYRDGDPPESCGHCLGFRVARGANDRLRRVLPQIRR